MAQAAGRVVRRIPSPVLFTTGQYKPPETVVVAYARVSTEKEEQEDSFERQVAHYTNLIKSKREWKFGGIYADSGITGTRAEKRPDFMRMIQDCRSGKINKVLVKSISRFARNTVDALNYIRELKDLDISVYFENENIDTMTPGGEVLLTILAAMAEQESRTMSTNIKWSYQKKFQNGEVILNTGMVLGYKKSAVGSYAIDEAEAAVVRRIYGEYLAGITVPQICRGLETDGIATKRGSTQWRTNAVLGILRNEKYTGNAILGKTYKPDVLSKKRMKNTGRSPMYYAENTHPAIIPQEMFEMAQAEMQRRKDEKDIAVGSSRYTSKYPFSGLLICGICGHRLRRHVRTIGKKKVPAWGCTNRISNGRAVCDSHHINEDVLERTYRAALGSVIGDAGEIIDVIQESCGIVMAQDSHQELDAVQREIVEIQKAVLALHKAKQQGTVRDTDYDLQILTYSQRMAELQERQKELKATANRYAEAKYWLDNLKEQMQSGNALSTDDAIIMRSLVEKIIVYDDRLEIHLRVGVVLEQGYNER